MLSTHWIHEKKATLIWKQGKNKKKLYISHARYLKHNFFAEKSLAQMAYGEILS